MNNKSRIFIKSYSILIVIIGSISILFFFPTSSGCNDFSTCILYSFCGLLLSALGIALFLLKNIARKFMLLFSIVFVGYYTFETVWLIKNDHTGQGLIGMVKGTGKLLLTCHFFFIYDGATSNINKTEKVPCPELPEWS